MTSQEILDKIVVAVENRQSFVVNALIRLYRIVSEKENTKEGAQEAWSEFGGVNEDRIEPKVYKSVSNQSNNESHGIPASECDNARNGRIIGELSSIVNSYSLESESNTPDFILGEFLFDMLLAFNKASRAKAEYNGPSEDTKHNYEKKGPNFAECVKVVTRGIKNDPELYQAYKSNIAMAIQDEFPAYYATMKLTNEYANKAADRFLQQWIK